MSKDDKAAPAAEKKPAPFVAAAESRFATSVEFSYPLTSYTPVAGTPLAHVLMPEYWANLHALKAGCRIWVIPEDEAWFAELLVRQVGPGFAKVVPLRGGELDALEPDAELIGKDFRLEWVNSTTKYRLVRVKDGHVLKEKLSDRIEAHRWLADHRKALAA